MVRCLLRVAGSCLLLALLVVWNGLPKSTAPPQLQQIAAELAVQGEAAEVPEPSAATSSAAPDASFPEAPAAWTPPAQAPTDVPVAPDSASVSRSTSRPTPVESALLPLPGKCVAEFLDPPCDMFKLIRYGMSNWRDKQVRPEQVDLQTSFTENDKKEALVGSFGGRLYLAYRERRERMADAVIFAEVLDLLAEISAHVELDVEFVIHTSDIPVVAKSADKVCGHSDRFVFSTSSGPLFCDVALGPGIRSASVIRTGNDLRTSDMPYEQKINRGFWRGSPYPARRCGSWKKSPRILMPKASLKYPDVLNASVSKIGCNSLEPADMCREINKMTPHRVPFLEQLKYRFLLTSAPVCTYTGRVYAFVASNSVVAMFSNGRHGVSQAIYAALQDNVHVKLVHGKAFVEELRSMQASWKELAALPPRAQSVFDWATSKDVQICYMYELLRAYRTKLAYKPSSEGTIARLLKTRTSSCGDKSYRPGADSVRADKGRRSYCIESWPVPVNASAMGEAAFAEWCAQVRARAPKF